LVLAKHLLPSNEGEIFNDVIPKFCAFHAFNFTFKGSDCCSDSAISFHYVNPQQMRILEYLIYQLRPFGIPIDGRPAIPDAPPDADLTATPWFASNETPTEPTSIRQQQIDKLFAHLSQSRFGGIG
jgi:hypothetical protein